MGSGDEHTDKEVPKERVIVTQSGVFTISGSDSGNRRRSGSLPLGERDISLSTSRRSSIQFASEDFQRVCESIRPDLLRSDSQSSQSSDSKTDDTCDDVIESPTGSRLSERRVSFVDEGGQHNLATALHRKRRPSLKHIPRQSILKH